MVVIGLTGGTATGKSTVAGIFAEMGACVIDADKVARELQEPGSDVLREIAQAFGDDVINADGSLNRRALGRICFAEKEQLARLNAIMHQRIRSKIESLVDRLEEALQSDQRDRSDGAIVIDAAIMFESGLDRITDVVIAVVADPEVQVQRLVRRTGLSDDEARERVSAQRSAREFAELSDFVIDTTDGPESFAEQACALYRTILRNHRG